MVCTEWGDVFLWAGTADRHMGSGYDFARYFASVLGCQKRENSHVRRWFDMSIGKSSGNGSGTRVFGVGSVEEYDVRKGSGIVTREVKATGAACDLDDWTWLMLMRELPSHLS